MDNINVDSQESLPANNTEMEGQGEEPIEARDSEEQVDPDTLFLVNSDTYPKRCQPLFEGVIPDFKPKTLIQIPIILPFHIAIPNGTFMSYAGEADEYMVILAYSTVVTQEVVISGEISNRPNLTRPRYRTRVEMVYVSTEEIEITAQEVNSQTGNTMMDNLSRVFDTCLGYVNEDLRAYIASTKDWDAHRISREQLQATAIWRKVELYDWQAGKVGLFMMNYNIPHEKTPLTDDEHQEVTRHASIIKAKQNPFILTIEFGLYAERYLRSGFYQEAVVYAQLSVETTLSNMFEQLLVEGSGITLAKAIARRENIPFMQLVKTELKKRLGGKWDTLDKTKPVGQWYRDTYKLRNKVVHEGYFPTIEEAHLAVEGAMALRRYAVRLMRNNSKRYPKLAEYLTLRKEDLPKT